jgi:acyl carrier protein
MNHFDTLRELIALTLAVPPEQITPETVQADLQEWDSVAHLNLMLAVEDAFQVRLDLEQIAGLTSVPAILDYLQGECPSR